MDRREQRLAVAVDDFVLARKDAVRAYLAPTAFWEMRDRNVERARLALRHAVIMQEANHG